MHCTRECWPSWKKEGKWQFDEARKGSGGKNLEKGLTVVLPRGSPWPSPMNPRIDLLRTHPHLFSSPVVTVSLREDRPSCHFRASPARPLISGWPPPRRTGLRTPVRKAWASSRILPLGHRESVHVSIMMACLGLCRAPLCGRAERIPPRKPPSAPLRAFHHWGIFARPTSPRRGGLCTPANGAAFHPIRHPRYGLGHSPNPRSLMKCLGLRTALPCGRTECAPPRKPALCAIFRPFPVRQPMPGSPTPRMNPVPGSAKRCLGMRTALPHGRRDRVPCVAPLERVL